MGAMPNENMYIAESQLMEKLSERHVRRVENMRRPRRAAASETVVEFSVVGGVLARVSRPARTRARDEPLIAEGAELLQGLSDAERREILLRGQPGHGVAAAVRFCTRWNDNA